MKKLYLLFLMLFILNRGTAQNPEFGFEDWNSDLAYSLLPQELSLPGNNTCYPYLADQAEVLTYDTYFVPDNVILPGWSSIIHGLLRTTDAHSGQYAAIVNMWYSGSAGILTYGSKAAVTPSDFPKVHFADKLYGISGFYKYKVDAFIPNDTLKKGTQLTIVTYKQNPFNGLMENLHRDSLLFPKSDEYREFYLPVSYTDPSVMPDSVSIWFSSRGLNSGGTSCMLSHFLYLDDITFHFSPYTLSVDQPALEEKIFFYPNPVKNTIYLKYDNTIIVKEIRLTDVSGKTIKVFRYPQKILNLENVSEGLYFMNIHTTKGIYNEKIVVRP